MNINPSSILYRYINSFSVLYKNHYEALGLTPKATQGEIKAAYYKLSMLYHPDKNKGSESANEKFKDITAAYEILGNFKSRRLYDRGMIGFEDVGMKKWGTEGTQDYSTKGARIQSSRGSFTGRTPIYDFDEWSRLHYGYTMERRANAKARYEENSRPESDQKVTVKKENTMLGVIVIFTIFLTFSYINRSSDLDSPPVKYKGSK